MSKRYTWMLVLGVILMLIVCPVKADEPASIEEIISYARTGMTDRVLPSNYNANHQVNADALKTGTTVQITKAQLKCYKDDTKQTLEATVPIALQNTTLWLFDDVTLIQEADSGNIVWNENSRTVTLGSSGYRVSGAKASISELSGQKVFLQMQDGTIHTFVCDSVSGNTLRIGGNETRNHPACYIKAFDIDESPENSNWHKKIDKEVEVGNIKATAEGDLSIECKAKGGFNWSDLCYEVNVKKFTINLDLNKITVDYETHDRGVELKLGHFEIEIVPGIVGIDVTPALFVKGKAGGSVTFDAEVEEGFSCVVSYFPWLGIPIIVPHDFQRLGNSQDFNFDNSTIEGELYAGICWGPSLSLLEGVIELGCVYEAGVVLFGFIQQGPWDDGNHYRWHACEDNQCLQGNIHKQIGPFSVEASALHAVTVTLYDFGPVKKYDPFLYFYTSRTFGDSGRGDTEEKGYCPHHSWRLDVTVKDQNGDPLPGATVSYTPAIHRYTKYTTGTTDSNGTVRLYVPDDPKASHTDDDPPVFTPSPEKVSVEVSWTNAAQKTFKAKKDHTAVKKESDMEFTFDVRECTLDFKDVTGYATGIPEPILFYPGITTKVQIPTSVPVYSGHEFLGWSKTAPTEEKPIPEGTFYTPGSQIDLNDNCTLFSVWKVDGFEFFDIEYNDNGGNCGPGREVFLTSAQTVCISSVIPEPGIEGQSFLGWSINQVEQDPSKLMQPGSEYAGRETITLYAQWSDFPPVIPVYITFHANGDETITGVPSIQVVPIREWSQLTHTVPVWDDQHIFLGWSRNNMDTEGRYFPGVYHYFAEDTDLYAVWKRDYHITEEPDGLVYCRNSGKALHFTGNGAYRYFNYLAVDGLPIDEKYYNASSGSTKIELKPEYLDTLADGDHTVRIVYYDGETDPVTITVETVHYFFASGDGQTWTKNSKDALGFIVKGDKDDENTYQKFTGIQVDGQAVSIAGYTTQAGSLKLWLQPVYLQNIDDGKHTLTVLFSDGKAEGSFQIQKPVPKTGDSTPLALWLVMILAGTICLGIIVTHQRITRLKR